MIIIRFKLGSQSPHQTPENDIKRGKKYNTLLWEKLQQKRIVIHELFSPAQTDCSFRLCIRSFIQKQKKFIYENDLKSAMEKNEDKLNGNVPRCHSNRNSSLLNIFLQLILYMPDKFMYFYVRRYFATQRERCFLLLRHIKVKSERVQRWRMMIKLPGLMSL